MNLHRTRQISSITVRELFSQIESQRYRGLFHPEQHYGRDEVPPIPTLSNVEPSLRRGKPASLLTSPPGNPG